MGGVAGKERGEQPLNATPRGQGQQRRIKNIEKYKKRKKRMIKKAKLPQRRGTTMVIMHKKKKALGKSTTLTSVFMISCL